MKGGRKNWDEHETKTTNDTPQERRNSRRTLLINGGKLGCRPGETQRDNLAVLVSGRNHGSDWFLNSVLHNVVDNRSRSRAIEKIGVGNELDNVCRSATGVLKENFSGAPEPAGIRTSRTIAK